MSLSTDRNPWDSVEVNLYITIDSTSRKVQNHVISKLRKYWPLETTQVHYFLDMILCLFDCYLADFSPKTVSWVKTNMIFRISIENWVELSIFQLFWRTFIFFEKFAPGRPQDWPKKWISRKRSSYCLVISHFAFHY